MLVKLRRRFDFVKNSLFVVLKNSLFAVFTKLLFTVPKMSSVGLIFVLFEELLQIR